MKVQFNNQGIAMMYESLIIAIYCYEIKTGYCKYMDPLQFGSADSYSNFVNTEGTKKFVKGKLRLASALGVLGFRFQDEEISNEIKTFFSRLEDCETQKQIVKFIEDLVEFVERL